MYITTEIYVNVNESRGNVNNYKLGLVKNIGLKKDMNDEARNMELTKRNTQTMDF